MEAAATDLSGAGAAADPTREPAGHGSGGTETPRIERKPGVRAQEPERRWPRTCPWLRKGSETLTADE